MPYFRYYFTIIFFFLLIGSAFGQSDVSLRMHYLANETSESINTLSPWFIIENTGNEGVTLSEITFRYWFTSEPSGDDMVIVDYALAGDENITSTVGEIAGERFVEFGFTSDASIPPYHSGVTTPNYLPPNTDTGEIQPRIHSSDWDLYDQSNDFSFDPSSSSFQLNENITIYYQGERVWGNSPLPSVEIDPENSTLSADPTSLTAGEPSTVTLTIFDLDGAPISGLSTTNFNISLSGSGYITSSGVSEVSEGVYQFQVTSDVVETITVAVGVTGIMIDDTAWISFDDFRASNYYPAGLDNSYLQAWFDAYDEDMLFEDADRTTPAQNGSRVLHWRDKAPTPSNATQFSLFMSPIYRTTAVFGGRPSLEFTGTDFLVFDGSFMANTNYTVSAFVARSSGKEFNPYLGGTSFDTNNNFHVFWSDNTTLNHHHYNNDYDVTVPAWSSGSMDGEHHILRYSADEGLPGRAIWRNGELMGQGGDLEPLNAWEGASIGRYIDGSQPDVYNERLEGHVGELIFHNRALSETERILIENYLAVKWGRSMSGGSQKIDPPVGFDQELVGIGRENASDFVTETAFLSGGLGLFSETDATGFLNADNNYFIAVHNGAEGLSPQPIMVGADLYDRSDRTWYIQKSIEPGHDGLVDIIIDFEETGLGTIDAEATYGLLYHEQDESFPPDSEILDFSQVVISGNRVVFTLFSDQIQTGFISMVFLVEDLVLYSRQSGSFHATDTWSVTGHDGDESGFFPPENSDIRVGGNGGNGHFIYLDNDVVLSEDGRITIRDTGDGAGTFQTGEAIVSGDGTFELSSGGTLVIGSSDGISETANAGAIQTQHRLFSTEANYVYRSDSEQTAGDGLPQDVQGLEIDNSHGVLLEQSIRVNGILQLTSGQLMIASDSQLIANQKHIMGGSLRFLRALTGSKGWRLMASPVETAFNDFVTGPDPSKKIVTQGFTDCDHPQEMPNILYFDEETEGDSLTTNSKWKTLNSLSDQVVPGRGYFVYVFDGVGGPGSDITERQDALPFEISAGGQENEPADGNDAFQFDISYSARQLYTEDEGWNLVGNPFGAGINWDDAVHWNKTDIHGSIYIWDPSENNGHGEYRYWNGLTGNNGSSFEALDGGVIAPFQAFWIKAESENAILSVSENAKTMGGDFIGKVAPDARPVSTFKHERTSFDVLRIQVEHGASGLASEARLLFSEEGKIEPDPLDTYRLTPLTSTYISTFFVREDQTPLVIQSLPNDIAPKIDVPLSVYGAMNGSPLGGRSRLTWTFPESLPENVSIRLIDTQTEVKIDMREESWYDFELCSRTAYEGKAKKLQRAGTLPDHVLPDDLVHSINQPGKPMVFKSLVEENSSRFKVEICRSKKAIPGSELPETVFLAQNYPNPFNPSTTIRFGLPDEKHVRLAVYDVLGREVEVLTDGRYQQGYHEVSWDAGKASSGLYIYRLETGKSVESRKMMLVK